MFRNKNSLTHLLTYSLCAIALIVLFIFFIDAPLYIWMREISNPAAWLWTFIEEWTESRILIIATFSISLVLYGALKKERNRVDSNLRSFNAFITSFCALIVAWLSCGILKQVIGRARPFLFEATGAMEFKPFTSYQWEFASMPSGHASAIFALCVSLGMFFPRIKYYAWGVAAFVCVSRIFAGAHFPSDVLLGALVGTLSVLFARYMLKKFNVYK